MSAIINAVLKYRLLHIAYWVWAFIGLYHQRTEFFGYDPLKNLPDTIIIISSQMLCVYFCIYFLLPRFLNRNKYALFISFSLLTIFTCAFLSSIAQNIYTLIIEGEPIVNLLFITFTQSIDALIVTTIFIALVILTQRYRHEQQTKRLEKEKLEAELSFLKSQINPHFLFNALNSIYVLIDVDKKIATETLLKFSGLLRYQLYECAENEVDITREISFLQNYIGLEKVRNGDLINVKVDFIVENPFRIAPFILIPFVENAFKHVSRFPDKPNNIMIKGTSLNGDFSLCVSNTYNPNELNNSRLNGIGLQNVKRRLELLYPSRYKLGFDKNDKFFSVNLTIDTKHEMHSN